MAGPARAATHGTRPLILLRMERLSPAVLLVLFDDIPDRMEIEEPRQGIQFGVRANRNLEPAGSWWLEVRDPATGLEAAGHPAQQVPFRRGSAGVIHLTDLRRQLTTKYASVVGPTLDSAEMALQLLRYPYRQRFGSTSGGFTDVLDTHFSLEDLAGWLKVKR